MNKPYEFIELFTKHQDLFKQAQQACMERHHWSPFAESPASYPDSDAAKQEGLERFNTYLNESFEINQPGTAAGYLGHEISPYTKQALGVRYPLSELDSLFEAAEQAMIAWSTSTIETRTGILLEVIDQLYKKHIFTLTYAVMHTTGQSFNMSYTGSGVNALDRGIEALVYAYQSMKSVTQKAYWSRSFGSSTISMEKYYRLIPKGVAVCFSCASFPTWNALPSIMASLATGNAVIVKAHPATILPMAIVIHVFRQVLSERGFDPDLVTLALDTAEQPIGKEIIKHPKTAIVDFTGSVRFGKWVEENAHPAISYTETAGCNTVILESTDDLDSVVRSLATTLCMFSAQMCTSPQNIYIPKAGVKTPDGIVPLDEVAQKLATAIQAIAQNPKRAAMILSVIQSDDTISLLQQMSEEGSKRGSVILESQPYLHPDYPHARTATPLMIQLEKTERDMYTQERFGPISFIIACENDNDALEQATTDVHEFGGLTAFVYSQNEAFIHLCEQKYARAGAQLTTNLTGPMPLNFAAAYSDYHVTGLNPAGNASLTDASFIAGRYRITQSRRPVTHPVN